MSIADRILSALLYIIIFGVLGTFVAAGIIYYYTIQNPQCETFEKSLSNEKIIHAAIDYILQPYRYSRKTGGNVNIAGTYVYGSAYKYDILDASGVIPYYHVRTNFQDKEEFLKYNPDCCEIVATKEGIKNGVQVSKHLRNDTYHWYPNIVRLKYRTHTYDKREFNKDISVDIAVSECGTASSGYYD